MIRKTHLFSILTLSLIYCSISNAQTGEYSPVAPEKLSKLISQKIDLEKEGTFKDRFSIQLFYGGLNGAEKTNGRYDSLALPYKSRMVYEEPNHKIWVGHFKNRLDADRALLEIKELFPNAFILKL